MTTLAPSIAIDDPLVSARWRILAGRALVVFLVASALLSRLTYLIKPWDHDARIFVYQGKMVVDGLRFCHDLIDNKFPSVGLMTSVAWRAFGTHWFAYVILQTVMAGMSALLLGRMAARTFGEYARWATTLFAMVYLNLNSAVFGGFQLETMQIFFAVLAAGACLEALRGGLARDAFVAGLAGGCAIMLKPTGACVLVAFALAMLVSLRNRKRWILHGLAAAVGVAIPLCVVLIYVVRFDILGDMPALYRQISRYANETPFEAMDVAKILIALLIGGVPLIVRGWVYRREEHRADDAQLDRATIVFVVAWLVLELIGVIMQRRMYAYHFLVTAAPASLAFGMLPRKKNSVALAAALLPATILSLLGAREVMIECWPPVYRMAVSDYIAARTTPNDCVWQDSVSRLLLETGCKPGSRIPLTFLFFNYDTAPIEYTDIMLHDFAVRRPKYIVLPTDVARKIRAEMGRSPEMERKRVRQANYWTAWMRIESWVQDHYDAETTIEHETVWRLRGS